MTRESREARKERKLAKKEKDIEHEGIVGRDIQPIDGEIPLREYEVARYHNYLRGLIAKGYLEITNKRLIYQVTGQSVYGPVLYHSEYAVDKSSGSTSAAGVASAIHDSFSRSRSSRGRSHCSGWSFSRRFQMRVRSWSII